MEPTGRKTITVHKEGEEGSLELDFDTGQITTQIDERPDWADGLSTALLAERHAFYEKRLGAKYAEDHSRPSGMAFQDLGWIGAAEDGQLLEISADTEYRMQVIADVLGIDREDDGKLGGSIAEVELEMTGATYSKSDYELLVDEQTRETFGQASEAADSTKTGTNGA